MHKLAKYDAALRALAAATRVDEVKAIRDKAAAMMEYARRAKDRELMTHAAGIKMRAQIRGGELLIEMAKRGERASSKDTLARGRTRLPRETPKLADLGVSKTESSRWQRLAMLAPADQAERVERALRRAVLTVDGFSRRTREEMRADDEERVRSLIKREGKYRTLVIDPPWDYEWLSVGGASKPGYATMTHEQLLALEVGQWAEDECHLYLWTTNNFMGRACDLMEAWGFQHKTVITWIKTDGSGKAKRGLGTYFRNTTEHVLFGMRGSLRTRRSNTATHFEAPIGKHSEKPEKFYEIVRTESYLPAGELFQRKAREGFVNLFAAEAAEAAE